MNIKSVLLCRVSSKEQEETGYSLPAQEKLLKEYSQNKGYKVSKVFSISESASGKKQREIFNSMIQYTKKKNVQILICEKADRLTRNFKDMVMIDEWLEKNEDRQVHLVKDSLVLHKNSRSQEKLNWGIRILFAKNYIDNLSEEVKKGQKEKISQGWLPTSPPIGYKTVGEKGRKIHVIEEEIKPYIEKMFQLYASGEYSLKKLTDTLHKSGLRNTNGNKIVKSRIHMLLQDPFYIGKIKWNNSLYQGKQETFISKSLFDQVQTVLKSKSTPKYRKHDFLFKGLIKCSECSGTITWETQKGHIYGHCNHYKECKQESWAKEENIEKQVIKAYKKLEVKNKRLADWILRALKESHKDEIDYYKNSQKQLQSQLERVKARMDRLYDDKLDAKIDESFFTRKFNQFTEEKDRILAQMQEHSDADNQHIMLGSQIYELSQKAEKLYKKADIENKRKLLRFVYKKINLNEGSISYEYTPTFKLLSHAVLSTNSSKLLKQRKTESKIFELQKQAENKAYKGDYEDFRPILLPD